MNILWLTAITGEICMYMMHGLRHRAYNPITHFRQQMKKHGVPVKADHKDVMNQLLWLYHDNGLKRHSLLPRTIEHLQKTKNYVEPTFQPAQHADGNQPGNPA